MKAKKTERPTATATPQQLLLWCVLDVHPTPYQIVATLGQSAAYWFKVARELRKLKKVVFASNGQPYPTLVLPTLVLSKTPRAETKQPLKDKPLTKAQKTLLAYVEKAAPRPYPLTTSAASRSGVLPKTRWCVVAQELARRGDLRIILHDNAWKAALPEDADRRHREYKEKIAELSKPSKSRRPTSLETASKHGLTVGEWRAWRAMQAQGLFGSREFEGVPSKDIQGLVDKGFCRLTWLEHAGTYNRKFRITLNAHINNAVEPEIPDESYVQMFHAARLEKERAEQKVQREQTLLDKDPVPAAFTSAEAQLWLHVRTSDKGQGLKIHPDARRTAMSLVAKGYLRIFEQDTDGWWWVSAFSLPTLPPFPKAELAPSSTRAPVLRNGFECYYLIVPDPMSGRQGVYTVHRISTVGQKNTQIVGRELEREHAESIVTNDNHRRIDAYERARRRLLTIG